MDERGFSLGAIVVTNTRSTDTYDEQSIVQRGDILDSPQQPYILIGHSNGGIVSRRSGHDSPHLVRGVITINSPHRGAPAMVWPRGVAKFTLQVFSLGLRGLCTPVRERGCRHREALLSGGILDSIGTPLGDYLSPRRVYGQMLPDSKFHSDTLNAQPETFTGVSISSVGPMHWIWAQIINDFVWS